MMSRVITEAGSYSDTKTDLEACQVHYQYTLGALIGTWLTIICIVLL